MQYNVTEPALTKAVLLELKQKAKQTLETLITERGIYASTDEGWAGPYHSWFGRDSAITAALLSDCVQFGGDVQLVEKACRGLLALAEWQGKTDDVRTGEQKGKIPHEIRTEFNDVDRYQHKASTNAKPWYIDPHDNVLKNWDSADSTPLWIIAVVRAHTALHKEISPLTLVQIKEALQWILARIEEGDGLVGFRGADEQPGRVYSGLHNQGWKDSYQIYQHEDGSLAKHPIKDALINADAWSALVIGAETFKADVAFAATLSEAAHSLKQRFNDIEGGFLLPNRKYYAQALDGDNRQLTQKAADIPMALWAYREKECIIQDTMLPVIVDFAMSSQLFNSKAGLRNYEKGTRFPIGTRYHGGDNVYWPFASGLVASGLLHFGYKEEANRLVEAYLLAIHTLGSNVEMFTESAQGELILWHHPELGQMSAHEQAWTAAAVYFGTCFLELKEVKE